MNISFFNSPISNTLPRCCATVKQIYAYIISSRAKENTEMLRSLVDGGIRRAYKAQNFDYVTFSGIFNVRKSDGLVSHSGFMCFDIDHIESEERLQEIKSLLVNDSLLHTVLLFRSPSGNGVKWVVEVPDRHWLCQITDAPAILSHTECTELTKNAVATPAILSPTNNTNIHKYENGKIICDNLCDLWENKGVDSVHFIAKGSKTFSSVRDNNERDIISHNHRLLYERIRAYLQKEYEIVCDATSDVARPCYLCHDPDAYYDEPTFRDNPAHKLLTSFVSTVGTQRAVSYRSQDRNESIDYRPLSADCRLNNWDTTDHLIRRIESRAVDITGDYLDWVRLGFAFANTFGESGRGFYHRVSQFHPRYDYNQTNRQYDNCLKTNRGLVGLGTAIHQLTN